MGSESHGSRDPGVDEGLARLIDIERGIEDRLREAERDAARRVEEARASSRQALAEDRAALEAALLEAEKADLDRHADALARIEGGQQARLAALSGLSEAEIDRLAREALALVLRAEGGAR